MKFLLSALFIFSFAFAEAQTPTIKVRKDSDSCQCKTSGQNSGNLIVNGFIRDLRKRPIEDARIELFKDGISEAVFCTDKNGHFSYSVTFGPTYSWLCSKCGYSPHSWSPQKFEANESNIVETATLYPLPKGKKSKKK